LGTVADSDHNSTPAAPVGELPTSGTIGTDFGSNFQRARSDAGLIESDASADDSSKASDSVLATVTSSTAVSVYSSVLFHLVVWGLALLICHWLGLTWDLRSEELAAPMQVSLGDEDIVDDLPQVNLIGDINPDLEKPSSTMQELAVQLQKSESARLVTTLEDAWKNLPGSLNEDDDGPGSAALLKVPESGLAVTKGSFTAFTIPAHPQPMESYRIVIEVRLPSDIKRFRVSDLNGEVRGSDGYTQKIPYDSRTPYAAGYPTPEKKIEILQASTALDVIDNKIQIVIKIPGGERLVKDVIRIRSRKLNEEQELTLVFGIRKPETPQPNPYEDADKANPNP
jgi:hypothetical protein